MIACPFCHLPEPPLAETEHAFAIRDKHPISPGHSLIVPRRHVSSIFALDDDDSRIRCLFYLARRHFMSPDDLAPGNAYAAAEGQEHPLG